MTYRENILQSYGMFSRTPQLRAMLCSIISITNSCGHPDHAQARTIQRNGTCDLSKLSTCMIRDLRCLDSPDQFKHMFHSLLIVPPPVCMEAFNDSSFAHWQSLTTADKWVMFISQCYWTDKHYRAIGESNPILWTVFRVAPTGRPIISSGMEMHRELLS